MRLAATGIIAETPDQRAPCLVVLPQDSQPASAWVRTPVPSASATSSRSPPASLSHRPVKWLDHPLVAWCPVLHLLPPTSVQAAGPLRTQWHPSAFRRPTAFPCFPH